MNYFIKCYKDMGASAEIAVMEPQAKVKELQVILHLTEQTKSFNQQLLSLSSALKQLLEDEVLLNAVPKFAQLFLSDSANQQEQVSTTIKELLNCSICYVQQAPLDGSKVALWLQLQTEVTNGYDGLIYYEHNGYKQYFTTDDCTTKNKEAGSSYEQTHELLDIYELQLKERGCTIEKDCIRTWFFVRDVDLNYQGVVTARRENFLLNGLSNQTHYIASTGIEGSTSNPKVKVLMNTNTISGLEKGQFQFLYAKDYLSSTYDYGVTFERGVCLNFGDRKNLYISGTASIDNKGIVVHTGDIVKQVLRTWVNVEALLAEAGCTFEDMMQLIVYLRDMADYQVVKSMFDEKFPLTPKIIVLASICRSSWLVEMECIASKAHFNPNYRDL